MAVALRLLPPLPPEPLILGQRCFDFTPLSVVVVKVRGKRKARTCAAPGPAQLPLEPRPRRSPRRSRALQQYAPRRTMVGAPPRSNAGKSLRTLVNRDREEANAIAAELEAAGVFALRPREGNGIDGDCETGPCPWVSCRHHLKIEVDPITGAVKDNFPDLDVDEMAETCSLRVAEKNRGRTLSLKRVGKYLNITQNLVFLLQQPALEELRRHFKEMEDEPGER